MPQIEVPDQIFRAAQRRAVDSGYASVDEYLLEVISHELDEATENLDAYFTPERLALCDRALEEIKSGKFFTAEQADAELAKRRAEWIRNNPAAR